MTRKRLTKGSYRKYESTADVYLDWDVDQLAQTLAEALQEEPE
jgi:hypothetical protein